MVNFRMMKIIHPLEMLDWVHGWFIRASDLLTKKPHPHRRMGLWGLNIASLFI
jgi:hypothetical protein